MFGGLRFAVVMMRIKHLLVDFELMPPDTDMAENNAVTRVLADLSTSSRPAKACPGS